MRGPGNHYGCHRSLIPKGSFPQPAQRLDASLPIYDNEILIRVERLNIDAASFRQLRQKGRDDPDAIGRQVLEIVKGRGKMHNPETNSGGMLLGVVAEVGKTASGKGLVVGDRVATLVSLTLTPLSLDSIEEVDLEKEQIKAKGHAILFESGLAHRLPADLPEPVALAIFDVCGAPALTMHLAPLGDRVVILGAGKAGVLSAAAARKKVGKAGKVFLLDQSQVAIEGAKLLPFINEAVQVDATDPRRVFEEVSRLTSAQMADLVVNCASGKGTEIASILAAKRSGTILFFNMATSFQAAVLAAEGIGHETRLVMGNGYYPGHADLALKLVREVEGLRPWFKKRFGS